MTNGCFDVIHAGHVEYLRDAKAKGAARGAFLLVMLNSDESIRKLKGETRPICSEAERTIVLDALESVDAVYVFDEERVDGWLRLLKPQVWAKGGDYSITTLDRGEVKAAQEIGCRIEIIPVLRNLSTSKIIAALAK